MENNKSPSRWERLKSAIAAHHKGTLIALSLRDSTAEEWNSIQDADFETAKKLSDFVGMLLRLGFVYLAFLFFAASSRNSETWYEKWPLGVCSMFALALYAFLFFRINNLIIVYWLSDTANWKSKPHKLVVMILGFIQSLIACWGVSKLAQAIAKASNLVH